MAKSSSLKKDTAPKTNAAFSKKTNGKPKPAKDNPSKYKSTENAEMDVMTLDPTDGLLKLFTDGLKDIYWAENQLIKALPKMAKATSLNSLKQAILDHLDQTREHAKRLEQVFDILGRDPQARKCDAMEGLTKEGEGVIENTDTDTPARDLGIIMASQKVEHYEMASYLGLKKMADNFGYSEISELLSQTLAEEEESDTILSEIAANDIRIPEENNTSMRSDKQMKKNSRNKASV